MAKLSHRNCGQQGNTKRTEKAEKEEQRNCWWFVAGDTIPDRTKMEKSQSQPSTK